MPIREDLKEFYGREWLEETRPRILARAGNRCENCAKPNGRLILTVTGHELQIADGLYPRITPVMFWTLAPVEKKIFAPGPRRYVTTFEPCQWRNQHGDIDATPAYIPENRRPSLQLGSIRHIVAQIGIAHLNNLAGDDRDENLRALCNWCHLLHDQSMHMAARRQTIAKRNDERRREDETRPLLLVYWDLDGKEAAV